MDERFYHRHHIREVVSGRLWKTTTIRRGGRRAPGRVHRSPAESKWSTEYHIEKLKTTTTATITYVVQCPQCPQCLQYLQFLRKWNFREQFHACKDLQFASRYPARQSFLTHDLSIQWTIDLQSNAEWVHVVIKSSTVGDRLRSPIPLFSLSHTTPPLPTADSDLRVGRLNFYVVQGYVGSRYQFLP